MTRLYTQIVVMFVLVAAAGCNRTPEICDAYRVARQAACDICAATPDDCPLEGLP